MVDTGLNETESDDLLGGLDISSSADINVPDSLLEQVIGQEHARSVVKKAADQQRHLLMIGSPGTGKSMLSKAMTEMLPSNELKDVLLFKNEDDDTSPKVRTVAKGKGEEIIEAHREEVDKKQRMYRVIAAIVALLVFGYALAIAQNLLLGIIAVGITYLVYRFGFSNLDAQMPEMLVDNSEQDTAPFKDATGAHSGAILGDVRHDPYQSSQMATQHTNEWNLVLFMKRTREFYLLMKLIHLILRTNRI
jgi:Lon-like ATP-dependent protease